MTRFIEFVNENRGLSIDSYSELYRWSVERIPDFWASMWDFAPIIFSRTYDVVVDDLNKFPGARWFEGARLNFAANLLRNTDNRPAFIFRGENRKEGKISYAQLYDRVAGLASALRETGIVQGDRVVGYMPNLPETAIAMLAATSIGASWASCGVDLGAPAALDRLGQIEPKILFTTDGYFYKGKEFSTLLSVESIAKNIPSLKRVVVVPFLTDKPKVNNVPGAVDYEEFWALEKQVKIEYEQLPFDHPGYIMFSSGTTGKPKCMVQSAGGVLINHLKELILHTDLRRDDKILYITSCSWMMWNWLMSSLAVGATIVLYDGNPNYPDLGAMWQLVQDEEITIFGCSASYVNYLRSQGFKPRQHYDLSSLREISQTGSPLSAEGFEYVYEAIKDSHFNSIAGGTDINGCFSAGSPTLSVYAGELQAPALGMKIKAYDEKANPVVDVQGELVCEAPAPSMPLYFWNDPNNEKYFDAYFRFYSKRKVWRHGDYIIINSKTGGITYLGRSDATLKPSGVRIGTAEIYNVVEKLPEIADTLAVGQNWKGDQRIILFVKIAPGHILTEALKNKIRKNLRENASPRHVPALIVEAPDVPYTFNMKKVEIAVWNIINGNPVANREAIVNPESLNYFCKILPELREKESGLDEK